MVQNPMEPSVSRWDGVVDEESHLACLRPSRTLLCPATDCGRDCSSTASSYWLVDGSTRFLTMVKNPMEPSTSRWDGVVDEESHLAYLGEPETRRPRAASPRGVPSPGKSTHLPPPFAQARPPWLGTPPPARSSRRRLRSTRWSASRRARWSRHREELGEEEGEEFRKSARAARAAAGAAPLLELCSLF